MDPPEYWSSKYRILESNANHDELCMEKEGKTIDQRKKVIPSDEDEPYSKIGELVFKYPNVKNPKKNFTTTGTAYLYM